MRILVIDDVVWSSEHTAAMITLAGGTGIDTTSRAYNVKEAERLLLDAVSAPEKRYDLLVIDLFMNGEREGGFRVADFLRDVVHPLGYHAIAVIHTRYKEYRAQYGDPYVNLLQQRAESYGSHIIRAILDKDDSCRQLLEFIRSHKLGLESASGIDKGSPGAETPTGHPDGSPLLRLRARVKLFIGRILERLATSDPSKTASRALVFSIIAVLAITAVHVLSLRQSWPIVLVASCYLLWLFSVFFSLYGLPRLSNELYAHTMRIPEAAFAFEHSTSRIVSAVRKSGGRKLDLETEADNIIGVYESMCATHFEHRLRAFCLNLITLIFLGAGYSSALVMSTTDCGRFYNNLDNRNNILDHLYFSAVTTLTIGFGDITPKSTEGRLGIMALCMAVLLLVVLGLNLLLAHESSRVGLVRGSILSGLRAWKSAAEDAAEDGLKRSEG